MSSAFLHVHLVEDLRPIGADGFDAKCQFDCNLADRLARGDQEENLEFPAGWVVMGRCWRIVLDRADKGFSHVETNVQELPSTTPRRPHNSVKGR